MLRSALSTFREGMEKAFGAAVDSGIPLSESLGLNPCSAAAGSSFLFVAQPGRQQGMAQVTSYGELYKHILYKTNAIETSTLNKHCRSSYAVPTDSLCWRRRGHLLSRKERFKE